MRIKHFYLLPLFIFLFGFSHVQKETILWYEVDLKQQDLSFYWKDANGKRYGSLGNLKNKLAEQNKHLVFAMNGGMYLKDGSPQGLFIENGAEKKRINLVKEAYGNFYLQPNGIFYITNSNEGVVCQTTSYPGNKGVKFATQSGPMLVIDGKIHSKFTKGSKNVHIRNGVGVLPNGNLLFAMSKETINLYDFASFFLERGCKNALYLDGFVSRTYLPSKKCTQTDGNFGVIIGVVK